MTDLRYNRFGHITGIDTFPSEDILESKRYTYDEINRLKTEKYERKVPAVDGQISKSYDYSTSPDENGLFKTTICYQDSFGNNLGQQTTTFYYDGLGQQVETWAGPEGQAILVKKIGYDEFGRKDFVEDGNNIRTEFDYDGFSRPKEIRFADGTKKVIDYNDAGRKVTEKIYDLDNGSYNLVGKSIKYLDNAGNTERIDQYPDVTGSTVYTTRYAYNKADQVISVTDPRGLTLNYDYDFFGLKKLDYPGTIRKDDIFEYAYQNKIRINKIELDGLEYIETEIDELDRVKKISYPDGRVMKNYFDDAGRLCESVLSSSDGTRKIKYEYDVTGNVDKATHTYDGIIVIRQRKWQPV